MAWLETWGSLDCDVVVCEVCGEKCVRYNQDKEAGARSWECARTVPSFCHGRE